MWLQLLSWLYCVSKKQHFTAISIQNVVFLLAHAVVVVAAVLFVAVEVGVEGVLVVVIVGVLCE